MENPAVLFELRGGRPVYINVVIPFYFGKIS